MEGVVFEDMPRLLKILVMVVAGEDAPADLAVGGGEEDLRHLEMEPGVLLRYDGWFHHWSSSGELYDGEAEAGQERQC